MFAAVADDLHAVGVKIDDKQTAAAWAKFLRRYHRT
jgi:hypothetical protein